MTEMENKAVEYAVQQGVATLTMQSAPVNALSRAIRVGLIEGINNALDDDSVVPLLLLLHYLFFRVELTSANSLVAICLPCCLRLDKIENALSRLLPFPDQHSAVA